MPNAHYPPLKPKAMFTQEEIEDLKNLPEYNRVGGVVHRWTVPDIGTPEHTFIEMPAVDHERFRCSRYGHIYVAWMARGGWFQFAINMDADTKIFKDWEPSNRIIDALFIVPWQSVTCIKLEYHCNDAYYSLSFGGHDLPVLKFNSREDAQLVLDEMQEEWFAAKKLPA